MNEGRRGEATILTTLSLFMQMLLSICKRPPLKLKIVSLGIMKHNMQWKNESLGLRGSQLALFLPPLLDTLSPRRVSQLPSTRNMIRIRTG
ncbi:hypothetical protein BDV33DRAFT_26474 [Aspergillus novoparasiticus]|uniref:Uncharacterized protein n=1 Tax=Aspergillus novoparasiticus TaxID=986946 RepID=A0A5N6EBN4_9EURO|nr:hypothetical protein BDV33DRAFT_26474 [Aspergillus novoparasiticus]